MKAELKHEMNRLYLISEMKSSDYKIQMVCNNKISCVIPIKLTQWNGIYTVYYDVTGLHPLDMVFSRKKVGMEEIIAILHAIGVLGEETKRHFLDMSDFVFSPNRIYWDLNSETLGFIFYPEEDNTGSMAEMAQFLLENVDNTDPEAVKIVCELYKEMREGTLNTEKLYNLFSYVSEEKAEIKEIKETIPRKDEENDFPFLSKDEKKKNIFQRVFSKKEPEKMEYEDDAMDLSDYGPISDEFSTAGEETVLLSLEEANKRFVLKSEEGEEFEIPKEASIILGSKADYVDICINNNSISKMHARFTVTEDEIRISDLSSKNGTRVNSVRITDEVLLKEGDEIRFGTAKFILCFV